MIFPKASNVNENDTEVVGARSDPPERATTYRVVQVAQKAFHSNGEEAA